MWISWIISFLSVYRPNYYILLARAKKFVVLRVFCKATPIWKDYYERKFVDLQMYQLSKKVIRQSNNIPAQQNASMNKIAKRMTLQMNLLIEKKLKIEVATKEKTIGKVHLLQFLVKTLFFEMSKAFCPDQRRIVQVWFDYSMVNCFWNYNIYIMPHIWKHCLSLIEFSRHTQFIASTESAHIIWLRDVSWNFSGILFFTEFQFQVKVGCFLHVWIVWII